MDQQNDWEQNFRDRVKALQVEFNAFFKARSLDSYFRIEKENNSSLSLHLIDNHELPPEIVKALSAAFVAAKPDKE
jgi:hypothetical protein